MIFNLSKAGLEPLEKVREEFEEILTQLNLTEYEVEQLANSIILAEERLQQLRLGTYIIPNMPSDFIVTVILSSLIVIESALKDKVISEIKEESKKATNEINQVLIQKYASSKKKKNKNFVSLS